MPNWIQDVFKWNEIANEVNTKNKVTRTAITRKTAWSFKKIQGDGGQEVETETGYLGGFKDVVSY